MKVVLQNGEYITEELFNRTQTGVIGLEEAARTIPNKSIKYPIGFVIPLGTLGNAPNQSIQFKSNFHIVAYVLASDLIDKELDFGDFNVGDRVQDQGQISKLTQRLDNLAEVRLGKGWRITIFNVKLSTAIESMCKGLSDLDTMKKAMDDLFAIVNSRVEQLSKSSINNKWPHELIDLFYVPLRAISADFSKTIKVNNVVPPQRLSRAQEAQSKLTKQKLIQSKTCDGILIETLVYDNYANGLRLLTNIESFTSSKIRIHSIENDSNIYLYVLKARISGDETEFIPIRQFAGKSKISGVDITSGCATRIIYNLINKNYTHWSFISIPNNLNLNLNTLNVLDA